MNICSEPGISAEVINYKVYRLILLSRAPHFALFKSNVIPIS